MSPLDLRIIQSLLGGGLLLLVYHQCLLHLNQSFHRVICLLLAQFCRIGRFALENGEELGLLLCQVGEAKLHGALMDKTFELLLQLVDPLHGVQALKRGVLHGILDVG